MDEAETLDEAPDGCTLLGLTVIEDEAPALIVLCDIEACCVAAIEAEGDGCGWAADDDAAFCCSEADVEALEFPWFCTLAELAEPPALIELAPAAEFDITAETEALFIIADIIKLFIGVFILAGAELDDASIMLCAMLIEGCKDTDATTVDEETRVNIKLTTNIVVKAIVFLISIRWLVCFSLQKSNKVDILTLVFFS